MSAPCPGDSATLSQPCPQETKPNHLHEYSLPAWTLADSGTIITCSVPRMDFRTPAPSPLQGAVLLLRVLCHLKAPSLSLETGNTSGFGGFDARAPSCGNVVTHMGWSPPEEPEASCCHHCPSTYNTHPSTLGLNGYTSLCVYTDTHIRSSLHKYIFKIYCSGKTGE